VGEVHKVCFVEGLVNFHKKWFLYYGTADAKIAVAVKIIKHICLQNLRTSKYI
jgi:predicted GH43/DUF377 family glycosyl hydrolase